MSSGCSIRSSRRGPRASPPGRPWCTGCRRWRRSGSTPSAGAGRRCARSCPRSRSAGRPSPAGRRSPWWRTCARTGWPHRRGEDDVVARPAATVRSGDDTVRSRVDRGADRGREVLAGVVARPRSRPRRSAHRECRSRASSGRPHHRRRRRPTGWRSSPRPR